MQQEQPRAPQQQQQQQQQPRAPQQQQQQQQRAPQQQQQQQPRRGGPSAGAAATTSYAAPSAFATQVHDASGATFRTLGLSEPILRALDEVGYEEPTPIQAQAIPSVLAGRDLLGIAQTGTGKTAAFSLPMLHLLSQRAPQLPHGATRPIRALVLTPTRELAAQILDCLEAYGKNLSLRYAVIFGGVGQEAQTRALREGLDILVATPGRLLDLMQQGFVALGSLQFFVLDEADRMLDMGFIHDVRRVIEKIPRVRQTLFFSATMPGDIQQLADSILTNPLRVAVTPVASTVEKVSQIIYHVGHKNDKRPLLIYLLQDPALARVLVFTRTKHGANRVVTFLDKANLVGAAIHGNKSQTAREKALAGFKDGSVRVLVATDLAARGIDVEGITHVINYDLPNVPETYVHRIGRTARAGASGHAIGFCQPDERPFLLDIERLIRLRLPVAVTPHLEGVVNVRQRDDVESLSDWSSDAETGRPRGGRNGPNGGGRRNGQQGQPRQPRQHQGQGLQQQQPQQQQQQQQRQQQQQQRTPQQQQQQQQQQPQQQQQQQQQRQQQQPQHQQQQQPLVQPVQSFQQQPRQQPPQQAPQPGLLQQLMSESQQLGGGDAGDGAGRAGRRRRHRGRGGAGEAAGDDRPATAQPQDHSRPDGGQRRQQPAKRVESLDGAHVQHQQQQASTSTPDGQPSPAAPKQGGGRRRFWHNRRPASAGGAQQ